MNFSTPERAVSTIRSMDWIERQRDQNRVPVNREFNGFPPLSDADAKAYGLDVNVNMKEAAMIAAEAISQYNSAFTSSGQYFTVKIEDAPMAKRDEWSAIVTEELKRMMTHPLSNGSRHYLDLWDNKAASIVMHGPGLQQWCGPDYWCPEFVAIEDFRVGTDANTSLDNVSWFAIRRRYTPGEIYEKAFGERSDPKWKKEPLKKILKAVEDDNFRKLFTDADWQSPTRWLEIIKQDAGYFASDAVLTIPMWDLYFQNDDNTGWHRRCVCDTDTPGDVQGKWLYTCGDRPVARRLSEILHLLPGDLNNKPPLKFHSMRGLMFTLVDPAFWSNLSMCWLLQHTMMGFRPWFRVQDPADRAKQQFVDVGDSVNIPDGVSIVPWEQRHRIDPNLVSMVMARMKQVMGEASDTYTQDLDTGTPKERTAFETNALMSLKNAGLQRILSKAYGIENWAYVEICRRACKKNTTDPDCQRFQIRCVQRGVDPRALNPEGWNVQPVTTMGQGNDSLELQRANMLMGIKPQLPPEGQDLVTYKYVAAVTKNPEEARQITRLGEQPRVTDAVHDAQLAFGALMQGVSVQPKSNFNPIEQVETLLAMMQQFIERTSALGAMEPEDTLGLNATALYVQAQIQRIAGDPREKQRVKAYSDQLGQLMNAVKALDQQTQEAKEAQNGNGMDPEAMQKMQQDQMKFQQSMGQKDANWRMRAGQREQGFVTEQQRKDQQFALDQQRQEQDHQIELRRQAESAAVDRVNTTLSAAQKRMQGVTR